ncbi:uncharacterized protein TNIN_223291 [Trichonephila inaurata madagascariensis]|uniref:Uncharacterized protein n=1 Tax=Trichonephila inaurata madagascariensis TaxID=2747483 RepID=A0A8X6XSB5_9ARAC|nr:uncharacterized protein TNIN_223291 [Trichonephila inaurata madagascariensis]
MELLVKKRGPIRANFTKSYNVIMEKLNVDDPIEREIKSNFANLERIYSDLTELDNQICGFLLENSNDDKYEAEYLAVEEYSAKMTHAKIRGLEKMKKLDHCIFCEKRHKSKECYHDKKLDFEQKQEILKNKRCCFTCLNFGPQSKVCKSNVQCLLCNKRHWALMCPELPSNKMRVKTPDLEEKRDVTLSNHCAQQKKFSFKPYKLISRQEGFLKSRWWEDPQWLKLPEEDWPVTVSQCNLEEILKERKKAIVSLINSVNLDKKWYLHRFSKYTEIVRLPAWVLLFVENCRHPDKRVTSHLTVSELDAAEKVLVKIVQQETLKNENVESD